jgi:hypothetical protein
MIPAAASGTPEGPKLLNERSPLKLVNGRQPGPTAHSQAPTLR